VEAPCPYLTDAEIADLCAPLKMPAAQCRYLQRQGFHFIRRPDGRPVLARSEFERVVGAARLGPPAPAAPHRSQPNLEGLRAWHEERERRREARAKKDSLP
jgi:hypothetical protein